TGAPRVSQSSLENWCLTTARQIIGFDDLAPDDDLFLAGLDSLGVVDLCAAVEEAGLGRLEPDRVLDLRTVGALVTDLGPRPPIDPSPVHVLNRDGTRPPIVMIPPGGGTAIGYRYLAEALGPDRPMAVVEARCLHTRQRISRTVERFAADAVADARDHLPDEGAVVIAAFSSGGRSRTRWPTVSPRNGRCTWCCSTPVRAWPGSTARPSVGRAGARPCSVTARGAWCRHRCATCALARGAAGPSGSRADPASTWSATAPCSG
ncbi:MAG: acyl carrier protein, partial [Actinomycetota bacterium]